LAALRWRTEPPDDPAAATALVAAQLPVLHAEVIDTYMDHPAVPPAVRRRFAALGGGV
ncbi:MAG: hypothetical protein JWR63_365, partial [Conexibacter sp.]|nr:hypothetical protein [Conexibacter sp.]